MLVRLGRAAIARAKAALFRSGPAASFPAEGGMFVRTRPELELPDMQWHFLIGLGAKRLRIPLPWQPNRDRMDQDGFTIRMCQLRPESRGRVTLRSSDPAERVRIQANYYATEADHRGFRDRLRMARLLVAQPAFEGWPRSEERSVGKEV